MTSTSKIQIFLVVLILGFLTGPRVMQALQKNTFDGESATSGDETIIPQDTISIKGASATASSSFSNLELEGKSVYVWDIVNHKKIFSKNDRTQLPLASVTKMMTAVVATEAFATEVEGAIISIHADDLQNEGDSGLFAGEKWKFQDILNLTLVSSSNDGASAIANSAGAFLSGNASSSDILLNKKVFVAKMNAKARAIGLENTTFLNESGLDADDLTSGSYGSARDMAMLFDYIYFKHPSIFTSTAKPDLDITSIDNITHHVVNTNQNVARTTGIIASKTGFTDLAGGNLVVVVDIGNNHPLVVAVLGSTREGRFSDVSKLLNATTLELADGAK